MDNSVWGRSNNPPPQTLPRNYQIPAQKVPQVIDTAMTPASEAQPRMRIRRRRVVTPQPPATPMDSIDGVFHFNETPKSATSPMDTTDAPVSLDRALPELQIPTIKLPGNDNITPADGDYARPIPPSEAPAPPKTPLNQIGILCDTPTAMPWVRERLPSVSDSSERSDSPTDSEDSSGTFSDIGDAFGSPEGTANQPPPGLNQAFSLLPSALPSNTATIRAASASASKRDNVSWTREMDEHLWDVFASIAGDPRNTPFKTLPGSEPPPGIVSKAAHAAKRSWKQKARTSPRAVSDEDLSVFASIDATIHDADSASTTSVAKSASTWPNSSATRRRLRFLCKRRSTLLPHYSRMMRASRSPSPDHTVRKGFGHASSPAARASRHGDVGSDSTVRDLKISLATSTAQSMQPSGMLASLTRGEALQAAEAGRSSDAETPFVRPGNRTRAHQKSQSLQAWLGLSRPSQSLEPRRLASPFEPETSSRHTWQPQTVVNNAVLQQPRPISGSMKRRAAELESGQPDEGSETHQRAVRPAAFASTFDARSQHSEHRAASEASGQLRFRALTTGAAGNPFQSNGAPTFALADLFTPTGGSQAAQPQASLWRQYGMQEAAAPSERPAAEQGSEDRASGMLLQPMTQDNEAAMRLGSPFAPSLEDPATATNGFPFT